MFIARLAVNAMAERRLAGRSIAVAEVREGAGQRCPFTANPQSAGARQPPVDRADERCNPDVEVALTVGFTPAQLAALEQIALERITSVDAAQRLVEEALEARAHRFAA